jgi:hypothetical protein
MITADSGATLGLSRVECGRCRLKAKPGFDIEFDGSGIGTVTYGALSAVDVKDVSDQINAGTSISTMNVPMWLGGALQQYRAHSPTY